MVELAREHKYIREFREIIKIYLELEAHDEGIFFDKIVSENELDIKNFGLSEEDMKILAKEIFDFLSGLGKGKILELDENLQFCPEILREDRFEENKKHFYRLCRSNPASHIDFLPHPFDLEEVRRRQFYKKLNWFGEFNPDFWKKVCKFFGISIHGSDRAIKQLCSIFPQLKRIYSYIAKVSLNQNSHGKIFFTPSRNNPQHYSWFPYVKVEELGTVINISPL